MKEEKGKTHRLRQSSLCRLQELSRLKLLMKILNLLSSDINVPIFYLSIIGMRIMQRQRILLRMRIFQL